MARIFCKIIFFTLIHNHSFSQIQKKSDKQKVIYDSTFTIKLLNTLENAKGKSSDSNAYKLYYVQYVIPPKLKSQSPDTIWAPVFGANTNEIMK